MTEETKVRAKKIKKVDLQLELLTKLSEKLNTLEEQVKERDDKLKELEAKTAAPDKTPGTGFQKYGTSEWQKWENGREKGYHRSNYVDVQSLMKQQYHGE